MKPSSWVPLGLPTPPTILKQILRQLLCRWRVIKDQVTPLQRWLKILNVERAGGENPPATLITIPPIWRKKKPSSCGLPRFFGWKLSGMHSIRKLNNLPVLLQKTISALKNPLKWNLFLRVGTFFLQRYAKKGDSLADQWTFRKHWLRLLAHVLFNFQCQLNRKHCTLH